MVGSLSRCEYGVRAFWAREEEADRTGWGGEQQCSSGAAAQQQCSISSASERASFAWLGKESVGSRGQRQAASDSRGGTAGSQHSATTHDSARRKSASFSSAG